MDVDRWRRRTPGRRTARSRWLLFWPWHTCRGRARLVRRPPLVQIARTLQCSRQPIGANALDPLGRPTAPKICSALARTEVPRAHKLSRNSSALAVIVGAHNEVRGPTDGIRPRTRAIVGPPLSDCCGKNRRGSRERGARLPHGFRAVVCNNTKECSCSAQRGGAAAHEAARSEPHAQGADETAAVEAAKMELAQTSPLRPPAWLRASAEGVFVRLCFQFCASCPL